MGFDDAHIAELAARRDLSPENYVAEIAEADCAHVRLEKSAVEKVPLRPPPETKTNFEVHRLRLTLEAIQKLLFLRESEKLDVTELARRFGCSTSDARRILD